MAAPQKGNAGVEGKESKGPEVVGPEVSEVMLVMLVDNEVRIEWAKVMVTTWWGTFS